MPDSYLEQDRRAGDFVSISGVDAYQAFNADLIDYTVTPGSVDAAYQFNPGKSGLVLFGGQKKPQELEMEFYVGGETHDEAQVNISRLLAASESCVIRIGESRFEYAAVLKSVKQEYANVDAYYHVTLTFTAVKRYPLVSVALTDSGSVYNPGSAAAGVRFCIRPTSAVSTMQVNGITCKSLAANETFVIDGITGEVHAGDRNRFADTDLSAFPMLQPGENRILLSRPVPVTVEFYPIF